MSPPPDLQEFEDRYKKAADGTTFLKKEAAEMVFAEAARASGSGSVREKLNLLNDAQLTSAAPFTWECPARFRRMIILYELTDFMTRAGSGKPSFDGALLLKRIADLAPSYDPNRPKGSKILIERGRVSLWQEGRLLINAEPVIEAAAAQEHARQEQERARQEAEKRQRELADELKRQREFVGPPYDETGPPETRRTPAPTAEPMPEPAPDAEPAPTKKKKFKFKLKGGSGNEEQRQREEQERREREERERREREERDSREEERIAREKIEREERERLAREEKRKQEESVLAAEEAAQAAEATARAEEQARLARERALEQARLEHERSQYEREGLVPPPYREHPDDFELTDEERDPLRIFAEPESEPEPEPEPLAPSEPPEPEPVTPEPPTPEPPAPEPIPYIPGQPLSREALRPLETADVVPWNREVVLTFDDDPLQMPDIVKNLEARNAKNYRFYVFAGPAFRDEALYEFGLSSKDGSPDLNTLPQSVTPASWYRSLQEKSARAGISTRDYLRQNMIKPEYLAAAARVKQELQSRYGSQWEARLYTITQYHASLVHPESVRDLHSHIRSWTPDQIKDDVRFFEIFINALFETDNYRVSRLRTPLGEGFYDNRDHSAAPRLTAAVQELNPNAQWDLWRTDSSDWRHASRGQPTNYAELAREAVRYRKQKRTSNRYEPDENLLLFHTKYYGGAEGQKKLDKYLAAIDAEYKKYEVKRYAADRQFRAQAKGTKMPNVQQEDGTAIRRLNKNELVSVIGERGDDFLVRLSDGTEGFVGQKYLEISITDRYGIPEQIQGRDVVYDFGEWTPDRVKELTAQLRKMGTMEQRMQALYEAWQDMPYQKRIAGLRHGFKGLTVEEPFAEKLVIRLDAMDCTEFPIYAMAMLGAKDYDDFVARVIQVKYERGEIADAKKQHYTYIRMQNWIAMGLAETLALPEDLLKHDSRTSTTIANRMETVPRRYDFIPTDKISEATPFLRTGDVFGFIISDSKNASFGYNNGVKREQIIGHMGFIKIENGTAYFIHSNASRYENGAQAGVSVAEYWNGTTNTLKQGTKRSLQQYLRDNGSDYKGIYVLRPTVTKADEPS